MIHAQQWDAIFVATTFSRALFLGTVDKEGNTL